jgi:hypothetical protein
MRFFKLLWKLWKNRNKILSRDKIFRSPPKPEDSLIGKMTIEEAENHTMKNLDVFKGRDIYESLLKDHEKWRHKTWRPFISKLEDNDELWLFRSPDKYWKNLSGREGFIIIRNGKKVAELVYIVS